MAAHRIASPLKASPEGEGVHPSQSATLRQHSIPSSRHNQAVFAFRLAREATGKLEAAYSGEGRRVALATDDPIFAVAFDSAKTRVRSMHVRYVQETDPLRQALLEIYAAVVLGTPYNDFNTH
jgi:hypothetical protein